MKRVLVIDSGKTFSPQIKEDFRGNGYDVEVFADMHQALHHYQRSGLSAEEGFDLILANVEGRSAEFLEKQHLAGKIERLVLLQSNLFSQDYYCTNRRIAVVCNIDQIFSCLNDIFNVPAESSG